MQNEGAFLLKFYGVFFAVVAAALAPCQLLGEQNSPWTTGSASLACVVGWNLIFLVFVPHHSKLWKQWQFCAILSLLQPIPDMFLVKVLGTLVFDPSPLRIAGAVPAAMLGMWTIALMPVLHLSDRMSNSITSACIAGAIVSFAWFLPPEHFCVPLRLWHPTPKVHLKIGHAAVYVLVAESIFGAAVVYADHAIRQGGTVWSRLFGAAAVMTVYTGSLAMAWLLLEEPW